MTKQNVIFGMEKIPVCTGYELDCNVHTDVINCEKILRAKSVYTYVSSFGSDASFYHKLDYLPTTAQDYAKLTGDAVHCRIFAVLKIYESE